MNVEQLIERLYAILDGQVDSTAESVREINDKLQEACEQTAERLRKCGELLDRGMLSEALAEADRQPNLLEMAAALSFPEWDDWREFAADRGCDSPLRPQQELVERVQDAFFAEQSVGKVLRRFRVLSLQKAPLSERLKCLRRLHQSEPSNAGWESDLREYERERCTQISREAAEAAAARDAERIGSLYREIAGSQWLVRPPKSLAQQIKKNHLALQSAAARESLVVIADQLNEAFAQFDVQAGYRLEEQWNSQLATARLASDDELLDLTAPAMQWLATQRQDEQNQAEHERAVAALRTAIVDHVSQEKLERLWHQVAQFELEVPESVLSRYQDRMQLFEDQRRRKSRLTLSLGVLALLLVAGGVGGGLWYLNRTRIVTAHAAHLDQLIQNGDLQAASVYLKDSIEEDWVLQHPDIAGRASSLEGLISKDGSRAALLADALERIRHDSGDTATWERLETAESELEKAKSLVSTDEEQVEYASVASAVAGRRRAMQSAADDEFQQEVSALEIRIEAATGLNEYAPLSSARNELADRPHISGSLKTALDQLKVALDSKRAMWQLDADREFAIKRVTRNINRLAEYKAALKAYADDKRFNDGTSADFKRVLEYDAAVWSHTPALNSLITECANTRTLTPESTQAALKSLQEFQASAPRMVLPSGLQEWATWCERIAARHPEAGPDLRDELEATLKQHARDAPLMVFLKSKDRFYTDKPPTLFNGKVLFKHYISPDFIDESVVHRVMFGVIANAKVDGKYQWQSPQSRFYDACSSKLPGCEGDAWETGFLDLCVKLKRDKDMEPVLAIAIYEALLNAGCEGSLPLTRLFKADRELLKSANEDIDVNWVGQEDHTTSQRLVEARKQAQRVLEKVGDPAAYAARLVELQKSRPVLDSQMSLKWIGWLRRQKDVSVITPDNLRQHRGKSVMMIDVPIDSDQQVKVVNIGTVTDAGIELTHQPAAEDSGSDVYIEGRAVFVASVDKW